MLEGVLGAGVEMAGCSSGVIRHLTDLVHYHYFGRGLGFPVIPLLSHRSLPLVPFLILHQRPHFFNIQIIFI